ncbi:hypothetical protein [Nitrosomonas sp. ANs5]|uniref:hypothetical protein n=1 Tax=Nitrosomonas sp. ANs5 TaxID=3423941 RepID=UPI003D341063
MSFAFHAIYRQMLPVDLDVAQDDMLRIDDADCIVATSSQEDGARLPVSGPVMIMGACDSPRRWWMGRPRW